MHSTVNRYTVTNPTDGLIRNKVESSKVYVHGLGSEAHRSKIDLIFRSFGRLQHVFIERGLEAYAVVIFEDEQDAFKAAFNLNGV